MKKVSTRIRITPLPNPNVDLNPRHKPQHRTQNPKTLLSTTLPLRLLPLPSSLASRRGKQTQSGSARTLLDKRGRTSLCCCCLPLRSGLTRRPKDDGSREVSNRARVWSSTRWRVIFWGITGWCRRSWSWRRRRRFLGMSAIGPGGEFWGNQAWIRRMSWVKNKHGMLMYPQISR